MSGPDLEGKLLTFLAGEFARENHQMVVRVELIYAPPNGYRQEPIGSWSPDDGKSAELFTDRGHAFVERLCGEIVQRAGDHADGFGVGRHRFIVRAIQSLGGRQIHQFSLAPSFDGDDQALTAQQLADPSQTNIIGQLMRHIENKERLSASVTDTYIRGMVNMMQTLRDENEALRNELSRRDQERLEYLVKIQEAESKEHERQIEAATVIADKERKDFAIKKIFGLLPVAVSQGLSALAKAKQKPKLGPDGKPLPEEEKEPTPLAALAMRLWGSLKTRQRDLIEDTLTIEQRIMMAEAMRVAAEGGSMILPALFSDLVDTLQPPQVKAVIGALEGEQASMFVELLQASKAQTAGPTGGGGDDASASSGADSQAQAPA